MNDFLKLLLPWQKTPKDQISDIFVYIIVISFILLGIRFSIKIFRQYRLIRSLTRKIRQFNRPARPSILPELEEEFDRKAKFAEAWQEFADSLITRQHNENQNENQIVYKTDEASFFFSEDRLLGQYMNLRFWNSIPAMLVGLGILGTFIGLVWGLGPFSSVDFQDTEGIKDAIKGLLSGVSTAFVTSVWGMVTSLLFNKIEKLAIGGINSEIVNLQRSLDEIFTLTVAQEIAFRQEDELAQQTAALKSFSTDLANNIKSAIAEERQEILNKVVELGPILEKLVSSIEELRQEKEESSAEAIEKLIEQFQNTLSTSTVTQMEALAKTVEKASQSLGDLPGWTKDIIDQQQKAIGEITSQTAQASADATGRISGSVQDAEKSISTLLLQQEKQTAAFEKQITNSKETLESGQKMLAEMETSLTSARQIIEKAQEFSDLLTTGANQLKASGQQLTQASTEFNRENEKYLTANRETIQQLENLHGKSEQLLNNSVQRFQKIDAGLQSIFSEIEKGLASYSTSARETINTYLKSFSDQLSKAVNALSSSIDALEGNFEDLNNRIEKLMGRKN